MWLIQKINLNNSMNNQKQLKKIGTGIQKEIDSLSKPSEQI